MTALLHERKALVRQINKNPALADQLNLQIAEIEKKLTAKVSESDQNFLRMFYRIAKEGLPEAVFNRLEDISSSRQDNHFKKTKTQG